MGIHLKIASIRVTSRRTAHSNAQPITSTGEISDYRGVQLDLCWLHVQPS